MGGIASAVGGILGGGGDSGGGGGPTSPPPLNYGQEAGQYLFGMDYRNTGGFADPRFQQDIIGSERMFQPQYAGLDLENIGTWMYGLEAGRVNPEIAATESEIEQLKKEIETQRLGATSTKGGTRTAHIRAFVKAEQDLADAQARLGELPDTIDTATPGLFEMQRAAAEQAGTTQRSEQALQQAADVGALEQYGGQITDAYRAADPYSTALADQASALAQEDTGLRAKGLEMLDSGLMDASEAEQQLQAMGMSLSDLSPTEQEALLSGRGMEFAASTGELTPLEQRRAQQSAREASTARGRGMDQSALYGEMQSRMSEEMNKREREIAMGSSLLGQEAAMRGSRLGQGAGMLTTSEGLAAQRRAEQMQQQQFGAGLIGQDAGIQSQRLGQAYGMQRGMAGDIGSMLFGRPSTSQAYGGQMLGSGLQQAGGPQGPSLFDPNTGINLALAQRGQDIDFMGAQAAMQGAQAQGQGSMMGGLFGGIGSAIGSIFS